MPIIREHGPSMRTLGRASYGAGQQFGRYESRQATANQMNQQRSLGLDQKRVGIEQQRADTERELGLRSQALQEELGAVQMEMQRAAMALDYVKFEQLDKRRLDLEAEIQRAQVNLQQQTLEKVAIPQVKIAAFAAQNDANARQAQLGQSAWQLEQQYPYTSFVSKAPAAHAAAKAEKYAPLYRFGTYGQNQLRLT